MSDRYRSGGGGGGSRQDHWREEERRGDRERRDGDRRDSGRHDSDRDRQRGGSLSHRDAEPHRSGSHRQSRSRSPHSSSHRDSGGSGSWREPAAQHFAPRSVQAQQPQREWDQGRQQQGPRFAPAAAGPHPSPGSVAGSAAEAAVVGACRACLNAAPVVQSTSACASVQQPQSFYSKPFLACFPATCLPAVRSMAGSGGGASRAGAVPAPAGASGLTAEQKRKLLWGGKKKEAESAAAAVAGAAAPSGAAPAAAAGMAAPALAAAIAPAAAAAAVAAPQAVYGRNRWDQAEFTSEQDRLKFIKLMVSGEIGCDRGVPHSRCWPALLTCSVAALLSLRPHLACWLPCAGRQSSGGNAAAAAAAGAQ
jgi:hypothetical protein